MIDYTKRPDKSGRFFLLQLHFPTATEIIKENNNNK